MNCSHYTLEELREGYLRCAEANLRLVSSAIAEDIILTELLINLMGKKSGKSH